MFISDEITHSWDGSFRGQDMNAAVFVYYLEIRCSNNEILIRQGDITLIK